MPDRLHTQLLEQALIRQGLSSQASDWLVELEVFDSIGSTNDRIVERIHGGVLKDIGENHGIAATAEFQSAGKGRRGKRWLGQSGLDIALSQSCCVASPAVAAEGMSLVIGLAVVAAIQHFGVENLSLKWPNDVLLDGKKLGGILIELVQQQENSFAVIGVGLNMGGFIEKQKAVEQAVADLSAYNIPRNALVSALISNIHKFCVNYRADGFGAFKDSWNKLHYYADQQVELKSESRCIQGRVTGIGARGELLLVDNTGQHAAYYAGELSLRAQN